MIFKSFPQRNGLAGISSLNDAIHEINANKSPIFEGKNGVKFYVNDRVIQTSNNYDLGVMNGEIGTVISRNERGITLLIDEKEIVYSNDDMYDLALSYAISIHKSQGSEYPAVIIPISSQHNFMLSRF